MGERIDDVLPFLLRRDNIVHYDDGQVVIYNRKEHPWNREFVRCDDVETVAQAIEQMITQGGGPAYTAGYALVELESMRGDKRTFYRAAKSILQHAPELPVNDGVRLLADNAPMEFWEPLTFEDKRDFDAYNAWLLQLVRHGIRIPERA